MAKKGKKGKKAKRAHLLPAGVPATETVEEKIARLEREATLLRKERASLQMDCAILRAAEAFMAKERE